DLSADLASDRSLESAATEGAAEIQERASRQSREADDDSLDISTANSFRASSMAVTFLAELPPDSWLIVEATGGRYRKIEVLVEGKTRSWYLRSPVSLIARIPASMLLVNRVTRVSLPPRLVEGENTAGLDLRVELLARPRMAPHTSLLTVS